MRHATQDTGLDDLAAHTRLNGGDGVATSDELLDAGRRGLKFFERFLPRYQAWTGRMPGGVSGMDAITATYDELRGIRFDRLRADAASLAQVHTDLLDHNEQLATNVSSLQNMWDGDAATAATDYGTSFLSDSTTVADTVDSAGTLINMSADRAETSVLMRARLVSGLDAHQVGGLTARQIDQVIAAARGTAQPEQLFEMAILPAFEPLSSVESLTNEQTFTGMLDQTSGWMGQRAKAWLDTVFVPTVDAQYSAFTQYCAITKQDVSDSWSGMTDGVGALNPQPDAPASSTAPASATPASATPAPATPDPAASTVPGGAAPTAVTYPAPVDSAGTTTPASTLPAPVSAGQIGDGVNGDQTPAGPSDASLAQAPSSGGNDVGQIGDGLTLTKPDAQGLSQLTVQHPDGSTGSYTVDLSGHGMDGGLPGQHMRTDADGNATIHDGATTITVHRPADGGPVTVTVDDGTGQPPKTYTVDFGDTGSPAGAGDPVLATHDTNALGSLGSSSSTPGAASMAIGGGGGGGTSIGGSAGLGGGGAPKTPPPTPQPGSYTGVGEAAPAPAAAVIAGTAAASAAGGAAAGGMGGGMMPMMGGMGMGGAGKDGERQGGRFNRAEDFFSEDTSSYKKIADMLEPELPGD